MSKEAWIYILSNKKNGTLYVGVTSNLVQRIWTHKQKNITGFSERYQLTTLVYFETCDDIVTAIQREKQIKKWRRAWKIRLIEQRNPHWEDLFPQIV